MILEYVYHRYFQYAQEFTGLQGGLGFLPHSSTLSTPFFSLDLRSAFPTACPPDITLPPLQIMAVDILPTALPLEASESFCKGVLPYIRGVVTGLGPGHEQDVDIRKALDRATIASDGSLREKHQWLQESVNKVFSDRGGHGQGQGPQFVKPARRKRILLLGSGMVAGPAVEEISRRSDVDLVLGWYYTSLSRLWLIVL